MRCSSYRGVSGRCLILVKRSNQYEQAICGKFDGSIGEDHRMHCVQFMRAVVQSLPVLGLTHLRGGLKLLSLVSSLNMAIAEKAAAETTNS